MVVTICGGKSTFLFVQKSDGELQCDAECESERAVYETQISEQSVESNSANVNEEEQVTNQNTKLYVWSLGHAELRHFTG